MSEIKSEADVGCFSNFVGGLFLLNATICFFVSYLN